MSDEDDLRRVSKELKGLRKGEGLTQPKVLRSESSLMQLPVVAQMVEDRDTGSNRALAVCALIHHFLHQHQDGRGFRALAWALNIDTSEPWRGVVRSRNGESCWLRLSMSALMVEANQ